MVEAGLTFFRNRLSEANSEEKLLFEDVREESVLFEDFFNATIKKSDAIKRILNFLERNDESALKEARDVIKEIIEINSNQRSIINRILGLEDKEKVLSKVLLNTYRRKIKKSINKFMISLKRYIEHLEDRFDFLLRLIKSEDRYIKKHFEGKLGLVQIRRLSKRFMYLYQLFRIENNTLTEVKAILTKITREFNILLNVESEKNKEKLGRIVYEDIINPNSNAFNQFFHEVYEPGFDYDENLMDSKEHMIGYLNRRYQGWHMKANQGRNHLIVAKINERIIGGMLIEFIKYSRKCAIGALWFLVLRPDLDKRLRLPAIKGVNEYCIRILNRDARLFGLELKGMLCEVENAQKMKEQGIISSKEDITHYRSLERFFRIHLHYRRFLYEYIQLPPEKDKESVFYLFHMVVPFAEEWKRKSMIPENEFLKIYVAWKYSLVEEYDFEKHPDYIRTLKHLRETIKEKGGIPFA